MLDIQSILATGETEQVEFKRKIDSPENIAGEIVAFANSNGGALYIGVDDDGAAIGVGNSESTFQQLTNICRDRCIPPVSPVLEQIQVEGHDLVVLTIQPELNRQKPYRTAGGRFYVRVGKDKKASIIDETKTFIKRNIRHPAIEHGFYREDIALYDDKALGEAIVNAVVHRDYSLSGSQIRLFVFDDRIEIRSPGRLPNSVTLDSIKFGVHAERNRTIATLLTQLGYMSAIGTGIPRLMIRLTRELTGREPEFELIGEELRVRFWANPKGIFR
ncbi:MAG: RNA-binding domain-containing protein [Chloroflexota bacterium]